MKAKHNETWELIQIAVFIVLLVVAIVFMVAAFSEHDWTQPVGPKLTDPHTNFFPKEKP